MNLLYDVGAQAIQGLRRIVNGFTGEPTVRAQLGPFLSARGVGFAPELLASELAVWQSQLFTR